jgi:hypothetical protein
VQHGVGLGTSQLHNSTGRDGGLISSSSRGKTEGSAGAVVFTCQPR